MVVNIDTNSFVSRRNTSNDASVSAMPVNMTNEIAISSGTPQMRTGSADPPVTQHVYSTTKETATAPKNNGEAIVFVGSNSNGKAICFTTLLFATMLARLLPIIWVRIIQGVRPARR